MANAVPAGIVTSRSVFAVVAGVDPFGTAVADSAAVRVAACVEVPLPQSAAESEAKLRRIAGNSVKCVFFIELPAVGAKKPPAAEAGREH
jgi:hypothetical protein